MRTVREVFETNTFGTMAMVQAVIPQMRARRAGTIVNVTSSVTLASMPLAAAYTGSKTAVEGFTGSLAHELGAFGIRVKLVEPGYGPTTRFAENGAGRMHGLIPDAYADYARPIFEAFSRPQATTRPEDVAEAVWRAVHDGSDQLHFPAGADAIALQDRGETRPHDRAASRTATTRGAGPHVTHQASWHPSSRCAGRSCL